MSTFFIHRPIFSAVLSILVVLGGVVTMIGLPIAQYPSISPPTVSVSAIYPGANATVVAETVATVIEESVNGVENLQYMQSVCANNGSYTLTLTFEIGTDLDIASVQVQNRVSSVESSLPEEVTRQGVSVTKKTTDIVLLIGVHAENPQDDRFDDLFLSNYASLQLKNELARVAGVGDVFLFGVGDYSMRVWLDPQKLKQRGLTTDDVLQAMREQNVQVAAGSIGQPPVPTGQAFQYTVSTLGRLTSPEQFEQIVIRTGDDRQLLRLGDVSEIELGSQSYDMRGMLNGQSTAIIAIYQLPGSNALDVADGVRARMEELSASFPDGLTYTVALDTTDFVRISIREVITTLFIAVALVFLTIFVFIQDWRATLIPAATIPVSLIGTFIVMGMLGFSINTISLFGIVLAIGIVVDDAIVVVENVARNIDESGLSAREATVKAMGEVTGPVIATTLVLLAVFVPTAAMGGITGQLYREFALTISTATVFSSINALTLSPALCGILMRKSPERRNPFFRLFNWVFDRCAAVYGGIVRSFLRVAVVVLLILGGVTAASALGFMRLPTGFVPPEDQGYLMGIAQLPDAASLERTEAVVAEINHILASTEGVADFVSIPGYSVLDGGQTSNGATFFISLDHWDDRTTPETSLGAIIRSIYGRLQQIQAANAFVFNPPPIPGVGSTGGLELQVQDRAALGVGTLQDVAGDLAFHASQDTTITSANTTFRANVPQVFVEIDRTKVKSMGIPLSSVFNTLGANLGSAYVNDINLFGRTYQVKLQARGDARDNIEDILNLEVRSATGQMVPLATLCEVRRTTGPSLITRYNLYPSARVTADTAPGVSTGDAMANIAALAGNTLPAGMGYEWAGIAFQQQQAGNEAIIIFGLALLLVYLVLCAQYESWMISLCVIFSVPFAAAGAVATLLAFGLENNVYAQIGLVLLIALASKNAILIVEFARELRSQGRPRFEAASEAAVLRFRPVLMTAFSFILGTLPLVLASGAGAASRKYLGITVFGGMLIGTLLIVLFVPAIYSVIQKLREVAGAESSTTKDPA